MTSSGGVAPVTQVGMWAVGLVAAAVLLFAALVVGIIPGDTTASLLGTLVVLTLVVAGSIALVVAIFRQGERGVSVFAAAVVLVGSVLFVLLHSLFISD